MLQPNNISIILPIPHLNFFRRTLQLRFLNMSNFMRILHITIVTSMLNAHIVHNMYGNLAQLNIQFGTRQNNLLEKVLQVSKFDNLISHQESVNFLICFIFLFVSVYLFFCQTQTGRRHFIRHIIDVLQHKKYPHYALCIHDIFFACFKRYNKRMKNYVWTQNVLKCKIVMYCHFLSQL